MLRQTFTRVPVRAFTSAARAMAEGDTGGSRASAGSDAFSDRAKASENQYVKDQEIQKLHALREKLHAQGKNIASLIEDIDDATKGTKSGDKK